MSANYESIRNRLRREPATWLVTGVAGFIGSNLLEILLKLGQKVIGLDNFATGHQHNLDDVRSVVSEQEWRKFRFIEGDITSLADCHKVCAGVTYVLHQAALGSVPRSIHDPLATHAANVTGFANMLVAAQDAKVRRFVYASSSSVYGDHPGLPKREDHVGEVLSPYAASKHMDEVYAKVFARVYGLSCVGLRYFNVFGPRQDPDGAYAAVIPRWIGQLLDGQPCQVFGDGETSRDFTYVANAVQANILAATVSSADTRSVYNVAFGRRLTLNELFAEIRSTLQKHLPDAPTMDAEHVDFRHGDVAHSLADIDAAVQTLGYSPLHSPEQGLDATVHWYLAAKVQIESKNFKKAS